MAVHTLRPGQAVTLPAGTVPGSLQIYCVGPEEGRVGIWIGGPPAQWYDIAPGHMIRFPIDGAQTWIRNGGESRLQVLYADALDALLVPDSMSIEDVEGASAWDEDEELAKQESRTEGK